MTNLSAKDRNNPRPQRPSDPFYWELATQADLPTIIDLMLEVLKEVDDGTLPRPDTKAAAVHIEKLIEFKQVILYKNNGVICGCMGVLLEPDWWSSDTKLHIGMVYVKPKFRGYKTMSAFLRLAEEYGKLNKVHSVSMTFHSPKDYKRKIQLMKRKGYVVESFTAIKLLNG